MSKKTERVVSFAFGATFLVAILVLALLLPAPTPYQYSVFRIVLALAAAGVAITFSGFLEIELGNWVKAGGGLAVFAVVFFYNPADLVVGPDAPPVALTLNRLVVQDAVVGEPVSAVVTVRNAGPARIFAEFKLEWLVDGVTRQEPMVRLDLDPTEEQSLQASLLFEEAGAHQVEVTIQQGLAAVAADRAIVEVGQRRDPLAPAADASPFDGSWYLEFHFERNTARPDEPARPWIAFVAQMRQEGASITGTLSSSYTTGVLTGLADATTLRGQIKLGWDVEPWESFRLTLGDDSQRAVGRAVVLVPETGETHHYTIRATRLASG